MLDKNDLNQIQELISASENRLFAYLELKMEPQIKLLAEGQKTILDTLTPKTETEKLRQEVEMRTAQMRHEVAENLEPSTSIKNSIIEKQDALIGMIYREETASPEMKNLKRDIESKKAVLQKRRLRIPKL